MNTNKPAILILILILILLSLTTQASEEASATPANRPETIIHYYIPFIAAAWTPTATATITIPMTGLPVVMTSKGDTLAEAQAAPYWSLPSQSLYAAIHHPSGLHPFYAISRTYLQFDAAKLAVIPLDRVVQADLVVYPNGNWMGCSGVNTTFLVGTWNELDPSAWNALGPELAAFWGADAVGAPYTLTLTAGSLAALWANQGQAALLVDEQAIPPAECNQFNTLRVSFFGYDFMPAPPHLVVWVREE